MGKSKDGFQIKEYIYPKQFYIACITLIDLNGRKLQACLTRVFKNLDILRQYVLFAANDIRNTELFDLTFEGYYIKANFDRLFPLKKEYWSKDNNSKYDFWQNFRDDGKIVKYWKMSEVLVTPDGQINGSNYFSFAVSFFKNSPLKDVELYIKNLNLVVDTRAKNAAFYTLQKPVKTSWLKNYRISQKSIPVSAYKN